MLEMKLELVLIVPGLSEIIRKEKYLISDFAFFDIFYQTNSSNQDLCYITSQQLLKPQYSNNYHYI